MANPTTEVEKREALAPEGAERTRARKVYVPRVDIHETSEAIVVAADMPGVDESSIDIRVEKNVLTINGTAERWSSSKHSLAHAEYDVGDYQRVFTLPNVIDQEHIEATMKNGVLKLTLPKASVAKPRRISVKVVAA
jgi:HSP20 family molecular chaperone IbpA